VSNVIVGDKGRSGSTASGGNAARLTDSQLKDFHELLDWRAGYPLPDGRYLGFSEDGEKDGHWKAPAGLEDRVQELLAHSNLKNKTILELGSCEGVMTVQLASLCRKVVAIEVRPRNIAAALIRGFLHGVTNCELRMADVRYIDGRIGKFDILFHSGLLYHLDNPIDHLFKVRDVSDFLFLDTHYGVDDQPHLEPTTLAFAGEVYDAYFYKEYGWADKFSGVEEHSIWLSRESLLRALNNVGFRQIKIVSEFQTARGPRIHIVAKRKRPWWKSLFGE